MRFCNRRRSVSSWVSPGPRRPMAPPRWRSRWVQPRTSRVAMWRSCANSTCSLPSWLRARWAKMSRIRPVRSTTRRSSAFSRLRSWTGVSAWLTSTRSAPVASQAAFTSSNLPVPIRIDGLGLSMRAGRTAATRAPADRASSVNSSSTPSAGGPPAWGWISSAFSPPRERSKNWVDIGHDVRATARDCKPAPGPDHSASGCAGSAASAVSGPAAPRRTLRAGTTVEIACL